MPIDSWTVADETPDLAARATAMIDAALVGTALARDAYWAAVRKGYNTPYNDPPRRDAGTLRADAAPLPAAPEAARAGELPQVDLPQAAGLPPLPVAAMAALAAEVRAT